MILIYKSTHLIAFTDIYSAVLLKFNHSSAIRLSEFQVGQDNSIASNSHSNLDMRIFFSVAILANKKQSRLNANDKQYGYNSSIPAESIRNWKVFWNKNYCTLDTHILSTMHRLGPQTCTFGISYSQIASNVYFLLFFLQHVLAIYCVNLLV